MASTSHHDSHVRQLFVLVILLIGFSVGLYVVLPSNSRPASPATPIFREPLTLSAESVARLPAGFPVRFIFGLDPVVVSGGITPSDTPGYEPVRDAVVTVHDAPERARSFYRAYFSGLGWTLTEGALQSSSEVTLTAEKQAQRLIVIFAGQDDGTTIFLSYIVSAPINAASDPGALRPTGFPPSRSIPPQE